MGRGNSIEFRAQGIYIHFFLINRHKVSNFHKLVFRKERGGGLICPQPTL